MEMEEGKLVCSECGLRFRLASSLKQHIQRRHPAETQEFECSICGSCFRLANSLTVHMRRKHPKPEIKKGIECSICARRFNLNRGLRKHMRAKHPSVENEIGNLTCSDCGLEFRLYNSLLTHRRRKHRPAEQERGNIVCPECGLRFRLSNSLLQRVRRKHPPTEKEMAQVEEHLPCTICGRRFRLHASLKSHVSRKHGGVLSLHEKPRCGRCDIVFTSRQALREHRRDVHATRVAQPCPERDCEFRYRRLDELRQHLSDTHGQSNEPIDMEFADVHGFRRWLAELQHYTNYRYLRGWASARVWQYRCNRSGTFTPKQQRRRRLKTAGSCKLGHACTAGVRVQLDSGPDGPVLVRAWLHHYGHGEELQHVQLSAIDRQLLQERVSVGVSCPRLLEEMQADRAHSTATLKLHSITRKDVENARARYLNTGTLQSRADEFRRHDEVYHASDVYLGRSHLGRSSDVVFDVVGDADHSHGDEYHVDGDGHHVAGEQHHVAVDVHESREDEFHRRVDIDDILVEFVEMSNDMEDGDAAVIDRFCRYLRIKTVHPTPDYAGCTEFLLDQAGRAGLQCRVVEPVANKPVIIMSWPGLQPQLPSLLLNSHTDVVPVFQEHWKCDAFNAVRDADGNIFARGTQDMKCVGMQYLEAICRLRAEGFQPLRNIHLTYVPDEEIGGVDGMAAFLKTDDWTGLNVGCALDEGLANPTDKMTVYYGERHTWKVVVTCAGNTGHGSRFIEGAPGEKLRRVINSFLDYREQQEMLLQQNQLLRLGDVTTVNLTIVKGGVQANMVPDRFEACFDCRIAQRSSPDEFEAQVQEWCASAGPGVTYTLGQRECNPTTSPVSDQNPWWSALSTCCRNMGVELEKEIFPAGTDSRYIRRLGIPCYGFSPMNNTPVLLHDHNEFINDRVFLRGVDIYVKLLRAMSGVPE